LWLQAANNSEDKLIFDKSHLVLSFYIQMMENKILIFSVLIQQEAVPVA